MVIKAIIFDCFGVLVGKGFNYNYSLAGGDPIADREFIDNILGQANLGLINDQDFRNAMADRLGISLGAWRAAVIKSDLADELLLDYIKDELRPKYKTAILSNANKGVIERKIGQERLSTCFDQVIVSADVGLVKPNPEIYYLTLRRLGVRAEECIFVDDRQIFLDVAAALGMQPILYRDFHQVKAAIEGLL